MVLSMGEQQRLSFIRLLALFTLAPKRKQLLQETLVFLDESTSAIDVQTEHEIYLHLTQLRVWFVTISHRSSLVHLHTKWLQFFPDRNCQQAIEPERMEDQVLFTSTDKDHDDNKLEKQEKSDCKRTVTKQFQVSFIPSSILFVHSQLTVRLLESDYKSCTTNCYLSTDQYFRTTAWSTTAIIYHICLRKMLLDGSSSSIYLNLCIYHFNLMIKSFKSK